MVSFGGREEGPLDLIIVKFRSEICHWYVIYLCCLEMDVPWITRKMSVFLFLLLKDVYIGKLIIVCVNIQR